MAKYSQCCKLVVIAISPLLQDTFPKPFINSLINFPKSKSYPNNRNNIVTMETTAIYYKKNNYLLQKMEYTVCNS